MDAITVKEISENIYEVKVESMTTTIHQITLPPDYCKKLTGSESDPEALIESSIRYLLERESNTSILSSFELSVIAMYFPRFEQEIKDYL